MAITNAAYIIKTISIEGYKSIRSLPDFELRRINVLIGANGAGKSNFVSFFKLLRELIQQRLQIHIAEQGGADAALFLGPKETRELRAKVYFGSNGFEFALAPTMTNQMYFRDERTIWIAPDQRKVSIPFGSGHAEARLKDHRTDSGLTAQFGPAHYVYQALSKWIVYHFHDTGPTAPVRRSWPINDNEFLRPDAANLAAFLLKISATAPDCYRGIRDVVRLAAPFFDDFKLRPIPSNEESIALEWTQKGSDYPFRASQLSDGTLRFICLVTALLQPSGGPATLLFDEPELGLHPYALTLLGSLFQKATAGWDGRQVIVSTQSALLLNEFAPEDIIVVDRKNGASSFERLTPEGLSVWLQDYSLGELWLKNVLGGRPHEESTRMVESSL